MDIDLNFTKEGRFFCLDSLCHLWMILKHFSLWKYFLKIVEIFLQWKIWWSILLTISTFIPLKRTRMKDRWEAIKNIVKRGCLYHCYKQQIRKGDQWIRDSNHDRNWHPKIQSQNNNVLMSPHVKNIYMPRTIYKVVFEHKLQLQS